MKNIIKTVRNIYPAHTNHYAISIFGLWGVRAPIPKWMNSEKGVFVKCSLNKYYKKKAVYPYLPSYVPLSVTGQTNSPIIKAVFYPTLRQANQVKYIMGAYQIEAICITQGNQVKLDPINPPRKFLITSEANIISQ